MSQSNLWNAVQGPMVIGGGGYTPPSLTPSGSLRTSMTEPEGVDLTRQGRRFTIARSAGVTGQAPIQAQPTTTAAWVLWNTHATKSLFFDMLGMVLDSGVGGATGHVVYVADITAPAQTGFATGLSVVNMSGSATASTALAIKSAVSVTAPAAPFWYPIASVPSAITPGVLGTAVANWEIRGRIALQPLHGLAMTIAGAAGTSPLFGPCAQWTELEFTMG